MPFYESVFIARQDLTPAKVSELTQKYIGVIEKEGGKVTKQENWGLRNFTYKINKTKKGYYVLFNIDAPAAAVVEMERLMRFDEDVLRSLTTKLEALVDTPSVMMEKVRRRREDVQEEVKEEEA